MRQTYIEICSSEQGFTLVEILIALLVFSISIVGLVNMSLVVTRTYPKSRHLAEAATLVQDKIEEFRTLGYSDPQLTDDGDPNDSFDQTGPPDHINETPGGIAGSLALSLPANPLIDIAGNKNRLGSIYTRFWNIQQLDSVKTVTVYVTWTDPQDGVLKTTNATTMIYKTQ